MFYYEEKFDILKVKNKIICLEMETNYEKDICDERIGRKYNKNL